MLASAERDELRAETLAGHDMDGDQSKDGYSMDGALVAFEAGLTPQQYVTSIQSAG